MRKVKIDGKICGGEALPSGSDQPRARIFKTAGTETALKILYLLSIEKELCVCDIAEILDMNISAISHQLKRLSLLKLVSSEKRGRTIFYSMRKNQFNN